MLLALQAGYIKRAGPPFAAIDAADDGDEELLTMLALLASLGVQIRANENPPQDAPARDAALEPAR